MRMDCEGAREHLDAWALGALDAYDARQLESHLASCAQCMGLADEARAHATALGMAVPLRAASSTLKARVMASARALTDVGRAGVSRWWRSAAATAAVVAIGAFAYGVVMQTRLDDLRHDKSLLAANATAESEQLAATETQVVKLVATQDVLDDKVRTQSAVLSVTLQPDAQWTALRGTEIAPGAIGQCVWSRAKALGAFIADNLPTPPPGTAYMMWLMYENGWVNGGSFEVDDQGRGQLILHRIWGNQSAGQLIGFAVTIEDLLEPSAPSTELALISPPDSE